MLAQRLHFLYVYANMISCEPKWKDLKYFTWFVVFSSVAISLTLRSCAKDLYEVERLKSRFTKFQKCTFVSH